MKAHMKITAVVAAIVLATGILSSPCFAADSLSGGLIAHYTFNGDFNDSAGSFNASKMGNVTFDNDSPTGSGKCANFQSGFLNVPNGSSLDPGARLTVSAWIKMAPDASGSGNSPIVFKYQPKVSESTMETLSAYVEGNNTLEMYQYSTAEDHSTQVTSVQAENLNLSESWTHVAFVCDGTYEKIYVNGVMKGHEQIDTGVLSGSFNSDGNFVIGGDSQNDTFHGKMSDLRIYNTALSDDDITALAGTGTTTHTIIFQLNNCNMVVDGKTVQIDPNNTGVYPYAQNGRTLVPIRAIVETMGGTINWTASNKQIDITKGDIKITMWLDNTNAVVNGKNVTLDVPPTANEGRTMVPVRFVSENLKAKVDWDGNTEKITISY